MMLDYLIPSETRRRLLAALYLHGQSGTVSSLARRAGVSTAAAHAELGLMCQAGLGRERINAGRRTFAAASDGPHTDAIVAMLQLPEQASPASPAMDVDAIKNNLAAYGARLPGHRLSVQPSLHLEEALALGCVLSRRDVAVARQLPVLFARHRDRIDFETLGAALHELRHKHTAGFLMALAAEQGDGDPLLSQQAEALRDRRRRRRVHFFSSHAQPRQARDENTLPLALRWHFHYPLPLAS